MQQRHANESVTAFVDNNTKKNEIADTKDIKRVKETFEKQNEIIYGKGEDAGLDQLS